MPSQVFTFIFLAIFLGLFSLISVQTAFRRLQRKDAVKQLDHVGKLFFYRYLSSIFYPHRDYEAIYFANLFTQTVLRFAYAVLALIVVIYYHLFSIRTPPPQLIEVINWPLSLIYLCGFFLVLFLFVEYLSRVLGTHHPKYTIKFCGPIASLFLTLFSPFILPIFKLLTYFPKIYVDSSHEPTQGARQELIDMIEEFNLNTQLDIHDKQLIESVMEFKYRIAREIMVPRVDIFCLADDITIEEAAKLLYQEGYSRIPVYKDTLDNIVGVLMYKDVLAHYMQYAQKQDNTLLQNPISSLVKGVLYTPETKKISHLLQEFRKKQVHLAIIVDEYGGTEGIVTIEDILEEIVGEIADEYDETEALFVPMTEGNWLIDARMSILDIEEQIGVAIPQDGDYDTIGGYIFHETGMIPPKGYLISQPNFEIEVIRSNDRRVEKLRIKSLESTS